ncbi:MAG: hypothetical protein ABIH03_14130, partial [Pseudomonadota bacterium]
AGEVTFSDEQQQHIDKLIGDRLTRAKTKWEADLESAKAKAAKDAETARLVEQQQYKELVERHQARIGELEPLEGRMQAYVEAVDGLLAAKLKELGEQATTAVDNLPGDPDALGKLHWLNANEALFAKTSPPDIGADRRGRSGKDVQITDDEVKEFAARMGLDPRFISKEHVAEIIKAREGARR